MIGYLSWIAAGLVAALVAGRWQRDPTGLPPGQRRGLLLCALGGAVLGAYLLQLPADLLGWHSPPPAGAPEDALPLGGRTVLGGLLGGWLAVELAKRQFGIRVPTGDGFALPLSLALGFGRLGCVTAGCCAGVACTPGPLAYTDAYGQARVPVQAIEAVFHFAAALVLAVLVHRDRQRPAGDRPRRGRRLAGYLLLLGALRFGLEFVRLQPAIMLGLTWHQLLAIALMAVAGGTFWRRSR